jgi:mono/diheme cytochrome c family protein
MWGSARSCRMALVVCLWLTGCSDDGARSVAAPASAVNADVERGRYLTQAADCVACHTTADGAPFAGGYALQSPFGTIYGTNITPDKDTGIGGYTANDLYGVLHDGTTPSGKHLYSAMPYTSYRLLAREDSDAIYAYLMSLPPVHLQNQITQLRWPYNWRWALAFWNWLYRDAPAAPTEKSTQWQRGRYVVDALGHCGECHTPRNRLGAMQWDAALTGGDLGHFRAPDITPQGLAERGWTPDDIKRYMRDGITAQGSAFDEMFMVIDLSTRYLSDADLAAAATYLFDDKPTTTTQSIAADTESTGRQVYVAVCAGCHGLEREGKPHVTVALQGNSTVKQNNPQNLVRAILLGLPEYDFPGLERRQEMPGFANTLNDADIATVVNYLRASGGQLADVTDASVAAYRH